MKKMLSEARIIELIREEWESKVNSLNEELKLAIHAQGKSQPLIAPELKIIHKSSGIRYTVDSISMRDVVLRTPEGDKFTVDGDEFEKEYEVL